MSENVIAILEGKLQFMIATMHERYQFITEHRTSIASLEEDIAANKAAISEIESAISILKEHEAN